MVSVLWFRRDLRLDDHPALLAAADDAGRRHGVVPLFVVDPALWGPSGPVRRAWLVRSLRDLDRRTGGRLVVRQGDPGEVVPRLADEAGSERVHITADAGPYGRRRDAAVARALDAAGRQLVATGTPYAVGPGTITQPSGEPYRVFSAFFRAWSRHGRPAPAPSGPVAAGDLWARDVDSEELPPEPDAAQMQGTTLPDVGEEAALARWRAFRDFALDDYDSDRDRPDLPGTSALSAHLKYGEIHPRTLLADIASLPTSAADRFRSELCWREFYADVLWHRPESARESNQHGWQWVAGSGTDPAPFFRIFNPVTQGETFDPNGDYVRRYVPELRHLAGRAVHEPWNSPDGYAHGYPPRIVDHAAERAEALRRYAQIK